MGKTRDAIDRPERRAMLKSAALVACGFSGTGRMARAAGAPQQASAIATPSNAVVEVDSGKVRGYTERGIYAFKGIPYGATTDGKNRWRRAQPAAPWPGVRSSTSYGPSPMPTRPTSACWTSSLH
jgi:para-nitrobenzyl esterase